MRGVQQRRYIMEYCVIVKTNKYFFEVKGLIEREVNAHIQRGWKPQGGVSIFKEETDGYTLAQAMIKED